MGLERAAGLLAAATLVVVASAAAAQGNGRVAYESGGSIYSIDAAGGAPALLHAGYLPAFSPDGERIAYAETPAGTIWVGNADGSNPVQIAADHYLSDLVWSPDGTRVAYISGSYSAGFAVSVAKADGSGSSVISRDASADAPPSWSPNGTELAFTTTNDADIAVAKADGSGRRLLIQDATQDLAPSWSPDGSLIAFFRGIYGSFALYTIRPDGSSLHQLSHGQADPSAPPVWSPDSLRLAFGSREFVAYTKVGPYYRHNVYSVGADGVGERRLTDSTSDDAGSNPAWSPDGTRIVFTTERSYYGSGRQLFVMNSDGSCETQLTSGSVSSPTWQARGSVPSADPLRCAALSLTGTLDASTDRPALDDARIYVYRGTITNNGNVASDPLHLATTPESGPFFYDSAAVSSGDCTFRADVSCTLQPLAPGASATVELRFQTFNSGTFPLEVEVAEAGQTPDGDLSDNVDEQYRRFPFCDISTQEGSTIRATGADDLICGTIGRDVISAGGGNDQVFGGLGHDTIHAGTGDDQVDGGGGTDYVYGEGGPDKLHGSFGDDVLIGGKGNDILRGDAGGDYLKGGPGVDRFFGGYGNDVIDSRDGLAEHVYCGDGTDRVLADKRDIVSSDCEKVVRRPAKPGPRK
jgi:RTX calcium-binding nonapeptide repeat (4 copies)/WD40-like Beta Propeller Repeat/Domain of unknown function DUF11